MNKYASLLIWGTGELGRRIFFHIGTENVEAFIDNDKNKIGKYFCEKPIISYETYKETYKDRFIILSPRESKQIEDQLLRDNVISFFKQCNCPSEFSEPVPRQILKDCVQSEIENEQSVVIYGKSLYSLILNHWVKNVKGEYADIIVPYGTDKTFLYLLQKNFPNMTFLPEESSEKIKNNDYKIYVADRWEMTHLQKVIEKKDRIVNAFSLAEEKNKYSNPELQKFKNIHKGEACFVIGLGPSLKAEDLSLLHKNHIISFSVNHIFKIYKDTEWRPEYYVMTDSRAFSNPELAHPEQCCKKNAFLPEREEEFWRKNSSEKNIKYYLRMNSPDMEEELFSEDVAKVCGHGGTCIYTCLQIAVYMGFRKIYLLGLDLSDLTRGINQTPKYAHFYPEKAQCRLWINEILKGYKAARKYTDAHNIHIYNATRGGYLEIFDRVDFDSLFQNGIFTPDAAVIDERSFSDDL